MSIDPSKYVFSIPFEIRKELCDILDANDLWEKLAALMPDLQLKDVEACRKVYGAGGSPTEILLAIWGSKGNKIVQLYNYLGRIRNIRAMRIIRHLVTPDCYHWEDECFSMNARHNDCETGYYPCYSDANSDQQSSKFENMERFSCSTIYNAPSIKYNEVLLATNNFADSQIIGRGGYGIVYKGDWKRTKVAVKRIQSKNNSIKEGLQEMRTLALYRHDNILPLYGFSFDGPEPCLIYQFMANGSLEDYIKCKEKTNILTWQQKWNIAIGAARGLHYLHTVGSAPLIHGDIKSANILLDRYFEARLGDFGLSRIGKVEFEKVSESLTSTAIAANVKGTLAYLPLEFLTRRIITTKLDIYGYGVVLLEIATGIGAFGCSLDESNLASYCHKINSSTKDNSHKNVELIMDHKCPSNDLQHNIYRNLLEMGLKCTETDWNDRPSSQRILDELIYYEST